MHSTASSCFKSVTAVMSFLLVNIMLLLRDMCSVSAQLTKQYLSSNILLQLKMRILMKKLDNLLFLESTEFYCSSWEKFKIKVTQLTTEHIINIDNHHIIKLIQIIEALMTVQKKSVQAVSISYAAVLKNVSVWSDISIICKILLCLIRKLMIVYLNMFSQDQECSIKQIIKKINKLKNNIVSEKVLIIYKLLSNDILIIMNITEIKK